MKKVAFLIDKMYGGGQERVVSNISMALPDNIKQYIILNDDKEGFPHKAEVIKLRNKRAESFIGRIIGYRKLKAEVKKIKKRYKFDTVISITNMYNVINSKTCVGEKNIVSVHMFRSSDDCGLRRVLYRKTTKKMFEKAHKVVAVSKHVKKDLIKSYGIDESKVKVIYNFFDTGAILETANKSEQKLYDKSKFNIVHVGRLTHQKGQWHLLRVLRKVLDEQPDVELTLIGEGEDKPRLKSLIDKLGIQDQVNFIDYTNNVYQYYKQADLLALPSLHEAFPMVIGEALSCGTPIIASDCKSGPREYFEPTMDLDATISETLNATYGVLVPAFSLKHDIEGVASENVKSEDLFAEAILNIINQKDVLTHYQKQSIARANDFDFKVLVKEWLEII